MSIVDPPHIHHLIYLIMWIYLIKKLTLNEKKSIFIIIIIVYSVVKESNILITLKNDLFGCFRIEENVTKTMKQV